MLSTQCLHKRYLQSTTDYHIYSYLTSDLQMDISLVEDRENLTLSDVVTASTNESFTSSGIVMPGRTFNYTFENAGEYIITGIVPSHIVSNIQLLSYFVQMWFPTFR